MHKSTSHHWWADFAQYGCFIKKAIQIQQCGEGIELIRPYCKEFQLIFTDRHQVHSHTTRVRLIIGYTDITDNDMILIILV